MVRFPKPSALQIIKFQSPQYDWMLRNSIHSLKFERSDEQTRSHICSGGMSLVRPRCKCSLKPSLPSVRSASGSLHGRSVPEIPTTDLASFFLLLPGAGRWACLRPVRTAHNKILETRTASEYAVGGQATVDYPQAFTEMNSEDSTRSEIPDRTAGLAIGLGIGIPFLVSVILIVVLTVKLRGLIDTLRPW